MIETLEENIKRCSINPMDLKHLKIEVLNSKYTVVLTDLNGDGILKGYGDSIEEAINDLHHSLL
ncbi:hypothetical protein [uncultured Aquimarina sp.]|uniref:hypothetical protein n=1 Tax=uncultured Aquimarina sp. TaxID=575652 RepID=UPI00263A1374|nr:hypothetical protein [uncultured Aquimarina sp.]